MTTETCIGQKKKKAKKSWAHVHQCLVAYWYEHMIIPSTLHDRDSPFYSGFPKSNVISSPILPPHHAEMFFSKQENPHNRSQREPTSRLWWNSTLNPQSADSGQRFEAFGWWLGDVGVHIPSWRGKWVLVFVKSTQVGCGAVRPKADKARRACQYSMMIIFPAELLVKFEMHLWSGWNSLFK